MARCFPYLPPGYSLGKLGNEASVESIKLQMETERAAKEQRKKDRRKEKKERRKEKKDKIKAHTEKNWAEPNSGSFLKVREAETELLEKSSLTEEHEQPIYLCVPSSPSDSTGNSNKRKRHSPPIDGSRSRGGNIIRIRLLPPKKPKEQDSTGRTDFPAERNNEIASRANEENSCPIAQESSYIVSGLPTGTDKEPICSSSGRDEAAAHGKVRTPLGHDTVMSNMQRVELEYRSLFEKWAPPQLQAQHIGPDEEWLFRGKNQDVHVEKKLKPCNDHISCSSTSLLRPRARYLHEADVYALPFTVPF